MAKLVIGNNKTVGVPAIVKEVVSVPNYVAPKNNVNGVYKADNTATFFTINGATSTLDFSLCYAFNSCSNLLGVNLSSLVNVDGDYAMYNGFSRSGISGALDLSSIERVGSSVYTNNGMTSAFSNCPNITSVDMSSLKFINAKNGMYGCFSGDTSLADVDVSSLCDIAGSYGMQECFRRCSALKTVKFYSLAKLTSNNEFHSCFYEGQVEHLYFYSMNGTGWGTNKTHFQQILTTVSGCTMHFPKNLDPQNGSTVVSNLNGYPGFWGTNTTLLFDLPSTYTLTGNDSKSYVRNPKYDTQTALAWREGTYLSTNFDPAYYTSGTSDPTVGTTIYSDASCTTSVTTVTAIA